MYEKNELHRRVHSRQMAHKELDNIYVLRLSLCKLTEYLGVYAFVSATCEGKVVLVCQ